jgi:hypothetical protein
MRFYGTWKCMTSPKDHKKILDSLDRGVRNAQNQEPSPAQIRARKKLRGRKKKNP